MTHGTRERARHYDGDAMFVGIPIELPEHLDAALLLPVESAQVSRGDLRSELHRLLNRHHRRCAQVAATPQLGDQIEVLRRLKHASESIDAAYCALGKDPDAQFAMYVALKNCARSHGIDDDFLSPHELCWRLDGKLLAPTVVIRAALRLLTGQILRPMSGLGKSKANLDAGLGTPTPGGVRRAQKSTYRARRNDSSRRLSEYQLATEAAHLWHLMSGEAPTYTNYDRALYDEPPRSASGRFVAAMMCLAEPALAGSKWRSRLETMVRYGITQARLELTQ